MQIVKGHDGLLVLVLVTNAAKPQPIRLAGDFVGAFLCHFAKHQQKHQHFFVDLVACLWTGIDGKPLAD
ncbi:hypothetical protein [Neisseria shayeganii]|uniref:Uncharacterized protein n=1 Tax=Neisseria shayeganii TaxID=607712 RepID=A0A7D7S831_9NEIS|nr:hypothetical protein [Neisseria shayeganii]QMT40411.1 hypothetical protein H3L94_11385 [Neisseria shayeganii]